MAQQNQSDNDVIINLLNKVGNKTKIHDTLSAEFENLVGDLLEEIDTPLSDDIMNETDIIKNESEKFYNRITEIGKLTNKGLINLNKAGVLGEMSEGYEARTIRLRLSYLAAFSYGRFIHKALGQPPSSAIVVFEDENGIYSKEISMKELILSAGSAGNIHEEWAKGFGDGTIEDKLNKEYEEEKKKIQSEEQIENHVQNIKIAYEHIKSHAVNIKDPKSEEGARGVYYIRLLSKSRKGWGTYRFLNYGDLKEAYALALMTQHNSQLDKICKTETSSIANDRSVELGSTLFHEYVTKVDNKGSLWGEDIRMENRQYAVKAANAQLPSLWQYIKIATMFKKMTTEQINNYLNNTNNSWKKGEKRGKGQRNKRVTGKDLEEAFYRKIQATVKKVKS